jgi:sugar transferase (PEP-CTERM/EpsH1 system associated)
MEPLLFLAHRIPYPPNKGDKVRSHHFLRHLAERHRIFLGTFIDDPEDWKHLRALKGLCAELHVEPIVPRWKRLSSAIGLLGREALSLPYFRSRTMARWVSDTVREKRITRAFAYSSPMAQYVLNLPGVRSWVDFVDMDSAKWGEYARLRKWPASALYRLEANRLLAYEREVASRAEASIFVTEAEAHRFCGSLLEHAQRVVAIPNGVDNDYYSPDRKFDSPFSPGEKPVVFTGAMDYWPNVDAVLWFAREVLPELRRNDASIRFYVVGMNPGPAVRALEGDVAIRVTGRVEDVRPYLQHGRVVVAPLRVARGIQNKVLEAMAMAKAVVATAASVSGLSVRPVEELEIATDSHDFASKVLSLMDRGKAAALGSRARSRVLKDYTWAASLGRLDEVLQRGARHAEPATTGAAEGMRCARPA